MKIIASVTGIACCVSAMASAADLPSRRASPAYVPPAAAAFSWTGLYAGLNAGYAFDGDASYSIVGNTALNAGAIAAGTRPGFARTRADGFTGGGQIGYNQEFGRGIIPSLGSGLPGGGLVAGIEADAAYTDLRRQTTFGPTSAMAIAGPVNFSSSTTFLGTVRGRLGVAYGNLLVFGSGGFAYGNVNDGTKYFVANTGVINYSGAVDTIRPGYAFGGGVEYAIPAISFLNALGSSAITLKAEYLHYDLGTATLFLPNLFGSVNSYTARIHNDGDLVRAAINYKFDLVAPAPVVARY